MHPALEANQSKRFQWSIADAWSLSRTISGPMTCISKSVCPVIVIVSEKKIQKILGTAFAVVTRTENFGPSDPRSSRLDMPFMQIIFLDPTNILSMWIRRVLQFVNSLLSRLTPPDAADPVPFALGTTAAISIVLVVD